MMITADIKKLFLKFFEDYSHKIVDSAPLIPHDDPSLMFVNAGMVPFKKLFTGDIKSQYDNIASCQKCVRAGGKHNDLDNVGFTTRHHTFFEMLGNFSFGDYFKEQAISMAWEFLTKELSIAKKKLSITVHNSDDEAYALWQKFAPATSITKMGNEDNFWHMGSSGPCGPCSEIFFTQDNGVPLEIWNLVFMQFDSNESGVLSALPNPCIDTGMGLERIAVVMQGVNDNFHNDIFTQLINGSKDIARDKDNDLAHRIVADHLRAIAFLMVDGVLPSNQGRGYVLRRIMRRAIRYVSKISDCNGNGNFLSRLFPVLIAAMGKEYPELIRANNVIVNALNEEEAKFLTTLENGMQILEKDKEKIMKASKLSGDIAFKLYDTYGFPLDLTMQVMADYKVEVDVQGFNKAMAEQKKRSNWSGSCEGQENHLLKLCNNSIKTEFVGNNNAKVVVMDAYFGDSSVDHFNNPKEVKLILNKSPFYAESGGQEGDCGTMVGEDVRLQVSDTKKINGVYVHYCTILEGSVGKGDELLAEIDTEYRRRIAVNHSATHLLHYALHKVIGSSVLQKGSLIASDYLRFDFNYKKALSREQLAKIECAVMDAIKCGYNINIETMTKQDAINKGATALFGEKYGETVRVVRMGESMELCGGTHVNNTSDIGLFKILEESSIGSGIRRIKAVSGHEAWRYVKDLPLQMLDNDVKHKNELAKLQKMFEKDQLKLYQRIVLATEFSSEMVGDIKLQVASIDKVPVNAIRNVLSNLCNKEKSLVTVVVSRFNSKSSIIVVVTKDLEQSIKATDLMKVVADKFDLSFGGNNIVANSGGFDWSAVKAIYELILNNISSVNS